MAIYYNIVYGLNLRSLVPRVEKVLGTVATQDVSHAGLRSAVPLHNILLRNVARKRQRLRTCVHPGSASELNNARVLLRARERYNNYYDAVRILRVMNLVAHCLPCPHCDGQ